jgi:hypothetical protein
VTLAEDGLDEQKFVTDAKNGHGITVSHTRSLVHETRGTSDHISIRSISTPSHNCT